MPADLLQIVKNLQAQATAAGHWEGARYLKEAIASYDQQIEANFNTHARAQLAAEQDQVIAQSEYQDMLRKNSVRLVASRYAEQQSDLRNGQLMFLPTSDRFLSDCKVVDWMGATAEKNPEGYTNRLLLEARALAAQQGYARVYLRSTRRNECILSFVRDSRGVVRRQPRSEQHHIEDCFMWPDESAPTPSADLNTLQRGVLRFQYENRGYELGVLHFMEQTKHQHISRYIARLESVAENETLRVFYSAPGVPERLLLSSEKRVNEKTGRREGVVTLNKLSENVAIWPAPVASKEESE